LGIKGGRIRSEPKGETIKNHQKYQKLSHFRNPHKLHRFSHFLSQTSPLRLQQAKARFKSKFERQIQTPPLQIHQEQKLQLLGFRPQTRYKTHPSHYCIIIEHVM
jgi:hypothetical protein